MKPPLSSRARSCPLCSQSMKKNGKNSSGTQRWYCPKCRWKRHRPIHDPVFSPYLGRKAFAPAFPFVLGMGDASAIYEIPSLRKPKRHSGDAAASSFSRGQVVSKLFKQLRNNLLPNKLLPTARKPH
ncbi:transposase-like zinc-binding domain-containing protein [Trueperella pyogenes]|uniref:transposase-like zinc-binding domain-containing protein n=1 Tax=Trueperella pyogenes TaxID=1661 RepID=UPI003F52F02E